MRPSRPVIPQADGGDRSPAGTETAHIEKEQARPGQHRAKRETSQGRNANHGESSDDDHKHNGNVLYDQH